MLGGGKKSSAGAQQGQGNVDHATSWLTVVFDPALAADDVKQACSTLGLNYQQAPLGEVAPQTSAAQFLNQLQQALKSGAHSSSSDIEIFGAGQDGFISRVAITGSWPHCPPGRLLHALRQLCLHLAGEESDEDLGQPVSAGRWSLWAELLKRKMLPYQEFKAVARAGATSNQPEDTAETGLEHFAALTISGELFADLQKLSEQLQVSHTHLLSFAVFHAIQQHGCDWRDEVPLRMLWLGDQYEQMQSPWPAIDWPLQEARGPAAVRSFASQHRQLEQDPAAVGTNLSGRTARWGLSGTYGLACGETGVLDPLVSDMLLVAACDRQLPVTLSWVTGTDYGNLSLNFRDGLMTKSTANQLLAATAAEIKAIVARADSSGRTWDVEALKKRWPPLEEPFRSLPFGKNVVPDALPVQALLPEAQKPPATSGRPATQRHDQSL